MTQRTVRLVERRTREVRLPRADAAFLAEHARHLVDVVPAFRRGRYRVTPRECVGWFDAPHTRLAIAPKIPWPNVRMLLGLRDDGESAATPGAELPDELLDALAREFAACLRDVTRTGLAADYREQAAEGAFLRGKLRAADQMRDAAVRAFPDRFHFTESVLDLDTPWNRVARATAAALLAHPTVRAATLGEVADAVAPLAAVPVAEVSEADFAAAAAEPRAAHYRELLALCRVVRDGLTAADLTRAGAGAFLVNLSRAFEQYLAAELDREVAARPGWSVESQPRFAVGPLTLQPDLLFRKRGRARVVLDAKWKVPGRTPDADDLHQVLAYAAVVGVRHVGLVYPGRRFARREFATAGGIRVSLYRVNVVGTSGECRASAARLARRLRG